MSNLLASGYMKGPLHLLTRTMPGHHKDTLSLEVIALDEQRNAPGQKSKIPPVLIF